MLIRYFSSSGTCITYPSEPIVLGTIVIFCTGSEFFCNAATSAWPISWYATILFSSLPSILSFFSLPAITTSTASNKSDWLTALLPALTAIIAASFIILARSEPTAPLVASAIASKSTESSISTSFACTFNISTLPLRSGFSTIILLSKRPGRRSALSNTSGLLVAPSITSPFELSKPSISDNNWLSVCSRSSLPPPYCVSRLLPTASISSIKIIHGAIACACLNKSLTLDAPTPTNISTKSEPDSEKNGTPASPATAFASKVLPVPGGPTRSAPFGSLAPISEYFLGLWRKSTSSVRDSIASSCPATFLNVTPVSFCTYILAVLFPTPITPPEPLDIMRNIKNSPPHKSSIGTSVVTTIYSMLDEPLGISFENLTPALLNLSTRL